MLKKLIVSFILLSAITLALVIWRANDIVATLKPTLQTKLSELADANVSVNGVSLSLVPQPQIELSQFGASKIKGSNLELKADRLLVGARLLPLLRGRFELTSLEINSPKITLGGKNLSSPPSANNAPIVNSELNGDRQSSATNLSVAVERIVIRDGELSLTEPKPLKLNKLDLDSKVALSGDDLKISSAKGRFGLNGVEPISFNVNDCGFNLASKLLNLDKLELATPAGSITLTSKTQPGSKESLINLRSDGLELKSLTDTLKALTAERPIASPLSGKVAPNLDLVVKAGTISELSGEIDLDTLASELSGGTRINLLAGKLNIKSLSQIATKEPAKTARGDLALSLRDGQITGWNLPKQIISKLEEVPVLGSELTRKIPDDLRSALDQPDTKVSELRAVANLASGSGRVSDLVLVSDIFSLKGAGTYAVGGEMDLDCEVIFNRQISDRMIRKVPELKALANGDGQLVFPVLISGKPPALITIPNISSIASKLTTGNIGTVIKEVIKDPKKLRGSIGKILGF